MTWSGAPAFSPSKELVRVLVGGRSSCEFPLSRFDRAIFRLACNRFKPIRELTEIFVHILSNHRMDKTKRRYMTLKPGSVALEGNASTDIAATQYAFTRFVLERLR
jgi:hypothetical protein